MTERPLADDIAVVTGAGSGIGAASAERLAGAGAYVACLDLDGARAEATAKAVVDAGGAASAHEVDVTRREQLVSVCAELAARHGRLDVLANVAGIISSATLLEATEQDLDRIFGVNVKGVLFGCQAAGPYMVRQGGGRIVNIASAAIDFSVEGNGVYAMSKAAVAQLTRTLATELGPAGVRVNAIAPGFAITGMTSRHFTAADGAVDEQRRAEVVEANRNANPLRSLCEPGDIADAVRYLASDSSRFVTGQTLRVNGGIAMPL